MSMSRVVSGFRGAALALVAGAALTAMSGRAMAAIDIDVDLSTQTMTVTHADGSQDVWPVSSGREGLETSTGSFRPQWFDDDHHSKEYNNAPMPHAIFFHGGEAIHGTFERGLGHPASHGCVRLSLRHSALLFGWARAEGATIEIHGEAPFAMAARRHVPVPTYATDDQDEVVPVRHRAAQSGGAYADDSDVPNYSRYVNRGRAGQGGDVQYIPDYVPGYDGY